MNFREIIRDKTRDNLLKNLSAINIDCTLAERGIIEEKLFNPWHRKSLGVIKINSDSPIEYINIVKKPGGKNSPPRWWNYFAIPAVTSNSKEGYFEVSSIRKKSFPVFGKVTSIVWKSNTSGQNLANKFTQDAEINLLALKLGESKVQSLHGNPSGYSIEIEFARSIRSGLLSLSAPNIPIDINQWSTINKIANLCFEN